MAELFSKLGIEWHIIIAQIVNFAILVYVLQRFAYKPILKLLDQRTANIKHDEEKSAKLSKELSEAEIISADMIKKSRDEGRTLIAKAEKEAVKRKEEILEQTKKDAAEIISQSKKTVGLERIKLAQDVKREIGEIVALSIEKAISNSANESYKSKLVEEALAIIKNSENPAK